MLRTYTRLHQVFVPTLPSSNLPGAQTSASWECLLPYLPVIKDGPFSTHADAPRLTTLSELSGFKKEGGY